MALRRRAGGLSRLLALILIVVAGVAVAVGRGWVFVPGLSEMAWGIEEALDDRDRPDPATLTEVHGVVGSEKVAFFEDQAIQGIFAVQGLKVTVESAGSRRIAEEVEGGDFDNE